MGSVQLGGLRAMVGHTHGVIAVEHTSIPARRKAPMSRMLASAWAAVGPKWTSASGRRATSASRSSVAATPDGADPAELADIHADLVGTTDTDADQFEGGMAE